jgi:hypothetical protein
LLRELQQSRILAIGISMGTRVVLIAFGYTVGLLNYGLFYTF